MPHYDNTVTFEHNPEKTLKVTMSETVSFPAGSTMEHSPITGVMTGVRLPNGELLKPWIVWELAENAEGEETEEDLGTAELEKREVQVGLDYERDAEELD